MFGIVVTCNGTDASATSTIKSVTIGTNTINVNQNVTATKGTATAGFIVVSCPAGTQATIQVLSSSAYNGSSTYMIFPN
jgi:hypothetical protein